MSKTMIWLSSPHLSGNEQKYVQQAFESNWIAPLGPNISGFETELEAFLGNECHVAVLNSGTAAIHLGLLLLGVKAGDEVLCQSMTFAATANPILYLGAEPVFIDSEKATWNLCPSALEQAIVERIKNGKKPKAIIAVHLYGMPFNVEEILALAAKYDIPVLEDSAEALGSTYVGQKCGTFGDMAVFSFNGNKIITTSAGGALISKNKNDKEKAIFLATQARDEAVHYQHSEIGFNYRMSNVCAGIGRGQLEVVEDRVSARRSMHAFYAEFFKEIPGVSLLTEPASQYFSNHWLSAITIDKTLSGKSAEALRLAFEQDSIEARPLWKPLHLQPVFENYPYYGNRVAEDLFENGLCLPSGSNVTENDRMRIKEVLSSFFCV